MSGAAKKGARFVVQDDLGIIGKAAILVRGGEILWVGREAKLPKGLVPRGAKLKKIDLGGRTVLPAFTECHTHLVFAGNRHDEFEMRMRGASYQEIAEKGGGIVATVKATRAASLKDLVATAQVRAEKFVRQGVTTIESKSGYGLRTKDEMKILEAAGKVKGPRMVRTYLGPHAIPTEYKGRAAEYIEKIVRTDLPLLHKNGFACRVDIFVEKGYFELNLARTYLSRAKEMGFDLAVHAEQLSHSGGAQLAVELGARSAEHLIEITEKDVRALAASEVSCVLLPAADMYLQCNYPPARALIDAGARVTLATDFNPGSSPTQSLSLVGVLARLEMKMSLAEVLAAYTIGSAHALGLEQKLGSVEPGKLADLAVFESDWTELFYSVGDQNAHSVWREGKPLFI